MKLSDNLQLLRQQHGLSQEALADQLHVARQTISKWETGQVVPELSSLVILCDLYRISLDRLVRGDDCAPCSMQANTSADEQIDFLLRAKRATYAGHGSEASPCRPSSHDYLFEELPWRYHDSYLGSSHFAGEEALWHNDTPVWSMNYVGRVLAEPFSGDFLKEALLRGTPQQPYRGPQLYQHGDWTYHCHTEGSFDWFSGHEEIFFGDVLVYECCFHGGKLG